jgi:hypothetical protein
VTVVKRKVLTVFRRIFHGIKHGAASAKIELTKQEICKKKNSLVATLATIALIFSLQFATDCKLSRPYIFCFLFFLPPYILSIISYFL